MRAPDRSVTASARSRARWLTTSMARRRPNDRAPRRQGRRGEVGAAPCERPSDLGLRAEQQHEAVGVLARRPRAVVTGEPRCTSGTRARGSSPSGSGALGRRPRCAAETSRHSDAQPVRPRASSTTRGCRGSTSLPPRAGVRRAGTGTGGAPPVRSARVGPRAEPAGRGALHPGAEARDPRRRDPRPPVARPRRGAPRDRGRGSARSRRRGRRARSAPCRRARRGR